MASSTPPHCSFTSTKPYGPYQTHRYPHHLQNHCRNHPQNPKLPLPKHTTSSAAASSSIAKTISATSAAVSKPSSSTKTPLPQPPIFPSFSAHKSSELSAAFSGRRSTRFVSKHSFNRSKISALARHSSSAEEALQELLRINGDEKGLRSLLLSFETRLSGADDYTFLLRELGNRRHCVKALKCFEFAVGREKKKNEQGKLASAMISILGRLGEVEKAKNVFENGLKEGYGNTVYAFSALISAYGRSGFSGEAISLFERMKSCGLRPNLVTYNAIIDACGKGGMEFCKVAEIFDEMLRNEVHPDRITFNSLLAVCSRGGLWEAARNLFDEMVYRGFEQDIFTYNTLLDAFCKGGQLDLASEIMSEMPSKNVLPNVVTYSTMIDGYAKAGRLGEALNLLNEMKFLGICLDRILYNTWLSIYAKLGRFEDVLSVCKDMESSGIEKDVVTYNALIGGYGKQGKYDEVKRVFNEMKSEHCLPNLLTYSTLIDVYSKGGLHREAMDIFRGFKKTGMKADVVLYSAVIDALCKSGLIESALALVDEMTKEGIRPNVVTYNSIIDACGRSSTYESHVGNQNKIEFHSLISKDVIGRDVDDGEDNQVIRIVSESPLYMQKHNKGGQEILCILEVFRKMNESEIKPNVVTFSAILNACSRCKSFEDASVLLEELKSFDNQVYGVARGLLLGFRDNVWDRAQSLFDEVKLMDLSTASAFDNALTDMLWHFGQKRGAQLVVLEGKKRQAWENIWSNSCLDLHLMSFGAAHAMVHSWLLNIRSSVFEGHELPKLVSILTGWGKHSKVVGDGTLRRAIEALLTGMGAPFQLAKCNLGRFISTGAVVAAWLKESGTLEILVLHDDRTHFGSAKYDQFIPHLQMLPT